MVKAMNASLQEGEWATAYAPIGGSEIRVQVFVADGKLYAKLPGSDAGIIAVDPSKTFIIH